MDSHLLFCSLLYLWSSQYSRHDCKCPDCHFKQSSISWEPKQFCTKKANSATLQVSTPNTNNNTWSPSDYTLEITFRGRFNPLLHNINKLATWRATKNLLPRKKHENGLSHAYLAWRLYVSQSLMATGPNLVHSFHTPSTNTIQGSKEESVLLYHHNRTWLEPIMREDSVQFNTTRQPFKRPYSQQQHGSCENETKLCAVWKRLKLCAPLPPLHACVCTCGSRNRWSVNSICPVSIRTQKQTTADSCVTKVIPKVTHFRDGRTSSVTGLYHPHEHHLFHERWRMERGNNKHGMECLGKAKRKLKPLVQLTSCPQDLQLFHILCSTRSHQSRTLKGATVCEEIATSSRHYAILA